MNPRLCAYLIGFPYGLFEDCLQRLGTLLDSSSGVARREVNQEAFASTGWRGKMRRGLQNRRAPAHDVLQAKDKSSA